MKEKSHKSKSHKSKEDHIERYPDKYSNILKEKHYKDTSNSKKDFKRDERIKSPERKRSNKTKSPARPSSQRRENDKHKSRKKDAFDESYEELSRKKRKIESELHALDLEEAAAKKHRKPESKKLKEQRPVKVKEEPVSDDSDARSSNARVHNKNSGGEKPKPSSKPPNDAAWGHSTEETKKVEKEKPNFGVSGKLAEDTNVYNGVVIKYNEPSEARKPRRRWRLYPFKGESDLPFIPIHRQSAYLFGRTRSIADIPIDHPSCSKQHAVLQFRLVPYAREDGTKGRRVRPYIIDLESSNGTFINSKRINPRCYVELVEKDVIKFGYSSREYVILHEESKDDDYEDVRDST